MKTSSLNPQPSNDHVSRRQFLQQSSLVAAGAAVAVQAPFVLTSHAAADDPIRIGLIGCGGRGLQVMQEFMWLEGARIAAVCDVHAARLTQARQEAGGESVRAYRDYRELLASNE